MANSDITRSQSEGKQDKEAARQGEELYRLLAENSNDLIRLHQLDGRSVYASPSVVQFLGTEPTDMLDPIHPDDLEKGRRWWQHILSGGKERIEWRAHDAAGHWRWLETSAVLVSYHDKPHVLTICRDVTDRKRDEEKLRESQRKVGELQRLAHIGYWERDLITDRITWSEETLRIFGGHVPEGFLTQAGLQERIHPDDRLTQQQAFSEALQGRRLYDVEYRVIRPDGEVRSVHVRDEIVADESGRPTRIFGTVQDITERKKAQEALRQNQERLHTVLTTLPVGVALIDRAGNIVLINPALKCIWGGVIISGRERWAESKGYWHDSGKRIAAAEWASVRALGKGQTSLNELIDIETYDGQHKTIQNSAAPIRDADGSIVGAVIVNEDVTERVRAEAALRESATRLQHLSRRLLAVQEEERRHLARELHDEFGQLLATITLHLHAARSVAGEAVRPRLEECAALLERAGGQVRSLALELCPTMLETQGLEATLRWLAQQHEQRTGIAVQIEGHLHRAPGDLAIACFRVAQEALTNVVRHAQARHVWIELSQSDSALSLVIRDDGVGFDVASTLAQAAERGRLGLLGMRERVQIVGGGLDVDSAPGRGTRIAISFPLQAE